MKGLLSGAALAVVIVASVSAQNRFIREEFADGEESEIAERAEEQFENRAFPADDITLQQLLGGYLAYQSVGKLPGGKKSNWQLVGPTQPFVPAINTYSGRDTMYSGRVTSLALSPTCSPGQCRIFVGAAGGGLWEADNAMARQLNWQPSGKGIPTNAIGSIVFDQTDAAGKTLYVGTGEANLSSDSQIGVGLYKSTDTGKTWRLIESTYPISAGRAISSIIIDPSNGRHILMGTDPSFLGDSGVSGGVTAPPDRPPLGVYESFDGGQTWTGHMLNIGASQMALDPRDPGTLYVATSIFGIYRRSPRLDGDDLFHRVLVAATNDRAALAITVKDNKTRIWAVHGGATSAATGVLKRVDDADIPTASLLTAWQTLTSSVKGTPGYTSFAFCTSQCWYDIVVASPPGRPDTVYLGGSMAYADILGSISPSNGRTLLRSTDGGVTFADMTRDAQSPPEGMHPDQHAIAFAPFNPDVVFAGSDGGVVRTSGEFVDASASCVGRGLLPGDLLNCQNWLRSIPTEIAGLNRGLATIQFQGVSINPSNPWDDIMGGTQDNGVFAYNGHGHGSWFMTDLGDGGQSGIDVADPDVRAHMYTRQFGAINFRGNDPTGWNGWYDPLLSALEPVPFYAAFIADPRVSGTWFLGMGRVWRTQDNGGPREFLETYCNFFTGPPPPPGTQCGDWVPLGSAFLSSPVYGTTKPGGNVSAIQRASGDNGTLWAATSRGRVLLSRNADAPNTTVTFQRLDTADQPNRFISGLDVDRGNPNRAFVAFSGYGSNTPTAKGHAYEVVYNNGSASWQDVSYDLGDLPILGIAFDDVTGDLFAATDFGVALLPGGTTHWKPAAGSLPPAAVYGLAIHTESRVLYAATHGRGIWRLDLSK